MTLEDYRISRPLPGGDGDHLAMDATDGRGRHVFLKQYSPLLRGGLDRWAKAIQHGVLHPNLVACVDAGVRADLQAPWAAFEWLDAAPVAALARDPRPILEGVLRGLAAAHAQNLFHLDVRPGYVLVGDRDGIVKLAGLGYAGWQATVKEPPGMSAGRMRRAPFDHLAPETAMGVPGSAATDVWMVGALAVRLTTGASVRPGFDQLQIFEKLTALMGDVDPRVLAAVPESWRIWVTRCLQRDTRARIPDAAAALAALPG
jgi:serine/threonine-protein kinase